MTPSVTVDDGAQENGLALMLADLMSQNMAQHPWKAKAFRLLRSSVAIKALDAGVALTMDFRNGSCTIFDGVVGEPALLIEADSEDILGLSNLPLLGPLPKIWEPAVHQMVNKLFGGRIRIHGLAGHPLSLVLLSTVLSVA